MNPIVTTRKFVHSGDQPQFTMTKQLLFEVSRIFTGFAHLAVACHLFWGCLPPLRTGVTLWPPRRLEPMRFWNFWTRRGCAQWWWAIKDVDGRCCPNISMVVSNTQTSTGVFMVNSAHEPWALEVQLFKRLPEDELPSLAPACEVKDYLPGPTDP